MADVWTPPAGHQQPTQPMLALTDIDRRAGSGRSPGGSRPSAAAAALVPNRSEWLTAQRTNDGAEICKHKNDQRGCPANNFNPGGRCEKGKTHVCDVLLEAGKTCGSTKRIRSTHDADRDGRPMIRSS